ncbi:Cell division cycle protein 27 [Phytophthora boehmeriae]|uniref:Cell division cycle protein 27 n=1 Tax=Phytophthora boehmeriae TaxID=109152 RepID=A0A8T1X736_9STRA|nr:Cell division cycle protein 27 [Phytophthora boehmeriae]
MEAVLATQVQRYLDAYVTDNARFLAERLVAHHPTEENILLLATCYYRAGQVARALAVLSGASRPENRYLLAWCNFEQGQFAEAENALLGGEDIDDLDALDNVPAGAAGLYLLGRVCRRGSRRQQAVACFVKSLEIDPFMWSAYEELCELGANIEASGFFGAANYFNSTGQRSCDVDYVNPADNDRRFGVEEDYHEANNAPFADDRLFGTPESPVDFGIATPKNVLTNSAGPLAYKTPNANNFNGSNSHTTTAVKKPRVTEGIGAPARQRKAYRRPLTESDEKHHANSRLSFSSAIIDASPLNEVELSYLARQATDFDKLSREAWIVAGNCFSLQKEHDTALAFFQRAIQLDPSFTYAYTLSGHEYVANEDFEKAVNCYRHAIRTDPRHYNAWYGLGTIYYRQEKFEFAEYHFKRALEINPRSSLLHCFLGMVLHATHKFDEALDTLAVAAELQPLNPQARFQRANVLITQQRFEEALAELHIVKNFAPRESSVHFMMGKVAKKLGRTEEAMKYFTSALYFHPKDNNLIKVAIDKINEPDLDDDDRM